MRLREISNIINSVDLSALEISIENSNSENHTMGKLVKLRKAVDQLSTIPALTSTTNILHGTTIFQTGMNTFSVSRREFGETIHPHLNELYKKSTALKDSIDDQIAPEKPESIIVKMPAARELGGLVSDLNTLNNALSRAVYYQNQDAKVEIVTWEPGSLWLEIFLGNERATKIVGSITYAALVILKRQSLAAGLSAHLRSLNLEPEIESAINDREEAAERSVLQSEAESITINNDQQENETPEQINVRKEDLKYAIKEFSKLIERGAEIHAALSAPAEVKLIFPPEFDPLKIESKIRRITDSLPADSQSDR